MVVTKTKKAKRREDAWNRAWENFNLPIWERGKKRKKVAERIRQHNIEVEKYAPKPTIKPEIRHVWLPPKVTGSVVERRDGKTRKYKNLGYDDAEASNLRSKKQRDLEEAKGVESKLRSKRLREW